MKNKITVEQKKRIIRTVIREIVVYLEEEKIRLVIHWEGGEHTELEVLKHKSNATDLKTNVDNLVKSQNSRISI